MVGEVANKAFECTTYDVLLKQKILNDADRWRYKCLIGIVPMATIAETP